MTRLTVLALMVASLVAASSWAQPAAPPPQPPPPPPPPASEPAGPTPTLPVDPERIRRALARPATLLPPPDTKLEVDGTTFRVNVNQKPFNIWEYWGPKDTAVASNVRTWYFSNWHAEYLRMVTPEAGRRAALYPGGMVPIMPGISALMNVIENAIERRAKRKAKEEVREALEQFFKEHPEARLPAPAAPEKPVP